MNRLNLILAAVAALLASTLFWEPAPVVPPVNMPLSTVATTSITQIALYNGAAQLPGIVLERHAGAWSITQPVAVAADEFAVGELLHLLNSNSSQQLAADSLDLAKLKLQPPLWRVHYISDDAAEPALSLSIGAIESLQGLRYVQVGETVHLVTDINPAPFDANYADLVARRLFPSDPSIQGLKLPQATYVQVNGQWTASDGTAHDGIAKLIKNWGQAQAQWTSRPAASDFDQVTSRVTVTLDNRNLDFLISARNPRLILIRPDIDVLYNLPGSATTELLDLAPAQ